jgi:MOSC domain-containing protein YiiM
MTGPEVALVSVRVGRPQVIGTHRGRPVRSGIRKEPVTSAVLHLGTVNLAGDGQADLSVHGGPDKAVYAYPSEHFPAWAAELGHPVGPGAFGENLTTAGAVEADVGIGDVWTWGDALLQVCQPRWPCFKLVIHSGTGDMAVRFRRSGRTGWYLRVLQPGDVPVAGPVRLAERDPAGVSVLDAHRAALPEAAPEEVDRVMAVSALAAQWRRVLTRDR